MVHKVLMTSFDQSSNEVTVVSRLVREGDKVKKGQIILEVETEKALINVETYVDEFIKEY